MKGTDRQVEILETFQSTGDMDETAHILNIAKEWVRRVVKHAETGSLAYEYSHKDTGCPDGEYPVCLECPLEKCKYG